MKAEDRKDQLLWHFDSMLPFLSTYLETTIPHLLNAEASCSRWVTSTETKRTRRSIAGDAFPSREGSRFGCGTTDKCQLVLNYPVRVRIRPPKGLVWHMTQISPQWLGNLTLRNQHHFVLPSFGNWLPCLNLAFRAVYHSVRNRHISPIRAREKERQRGNIRRVRSVCCRAHCRVHEMLRLLPWSHANLQKFVFCGRLIHCIWYPSVPSRVNVWSSKRALAPIESPSMESMRIQS